MNKKNRTIKVMCIVLLLTVISLTISSCTTKIWKTHFSNEINTANASKICKSKINASRLIDYQLAKKLERIENIKIEICKNIKKNIHNLSLSPFPCGRDGDIRLSEMPDIAELLKILKNDTSILRSTLLTKDSCLIKAFYEIGDITLKDKASCYLALKKLIKNRFNNKQSEEVIRDMSAIYLKINNVQASELCLEFNIKEFCQKNKIDVKVLNLNKCSLIRNGIIEDKFLNATYYLIVKPVCKNTSLFKVLKKNFSENIEIENLESFCKKINQYLALNLENEAINWLFNNHIYNRCILFKLLRSNISYENKLQRYKNFIYPEVFVVEYYNKNHELTRKIVMLSKETLNNIAKELFKEEWNLGENPDELVKKYDEKINMFILKKNEIKPK